ncbi:MAG: N-acyl homoserine lactonase family protein [Dehalococcoidia bacterium]|nr:N-acyl homoserine lactonase family protein [Dehalococcoidia bacterium]
MAKHIIRPVPLNRTKNAPQQLHMYLTGVGPRHTTATAVWYIEGPDKKIIVDAGGSTEEAIRAMKMLAPDSVVEHIQSIGEGLNRLGLKPEDIDIVIVTHLHKDHIEFAHEFTNARFIIQKAEYDSIDNPHPSVAPPLTNKEFLKGLDIDIIEGDQEIVEGVRVWLTPGHTPGGQSVVIDTAKGKAVITGFCCILQNFEPPEEVREMMPVITPGVHQDVIQVYDSVVRVKENADIVIPVHDAGFAERDRIPW